jgi:hypothetical protein
MSAIKAASPSMIRRARIDRFLNADMASPPSVLDVLAQLIAHHAPKLREIEGASLAIDDANEVLAQNVTRRPLHVRKDERDMAGVRPAFHPHPP